MTHEVIIPIKKTNNEMARDLILCLKYGSDYYNYLRKEEMRRIKNSLPNNAEKDFFIYKIENEIYGITDSVDFMMFIFSGNPTDGFGYIINGDEVHSATALPDKVPYAIPSKGQGNLVMLAQYMDTHPGPLNVLIGADSNSNKPGTSNDYDMKGNYHIGIFGMYDPVIIDDVLFLNIDITKHSEFIYMLYNKCGHISCINDNDSDRLSTHHGRFYFDMYNILQSGKSYVGPIISYTKGTIPIVGIDNKKGNKKLILDDSTGQYYYEDDNYFMVYSDKIKKSSTGKYYDFKPNLDKTLKRFIPSIEYISYADAIDEVPNNGSHLYAKNYNIKFTKP